MTRILTCSLDRSIFVDILCILYGLGSWIAMTGLWVELPVLVQRLPEGWTLGSNLSLVLQIANIGPIIYGVANKLWPKRIDEVVGTHVQMALGAVSCSLLIFLWHYTYPIGHNQYSIWLYVFSFGLSIMDCTSSVVFLPYMARFKEIYMTPYLIGEGLSGFLPSLVAIAQGIENVECRNESVIVHDDYTEENSTVYKMVPHLVQPRFSAELFFLFLMIMVMVSWIAFVFLDCLPSARREMVKNAGSPEDQTEKENVQMVLLDAHVKILDDVSEGCKEDSKEYFLRQSTRRNKAWKRERPSKISRQGNAGDIISRVNDQPDLLVRNKSPGVGTFGDSINADRQLTKDEHQASKKTYYYLLFLQGWASIATFGIFPAIQSYSSLPYGSRPFHLAVTLSGMAYPASCILALFFEWKSLRGVSFLSVLGTLISGYVLATAIMSPSPPLVNTEEGAIIVVVAWVLFVGILSYVKTIVTLFLRDMGSNALFWCGAVTQAGAAIGALLMFLLVNIAKVFKDDNLCII